MSQAPVASGAAARGCAATGVAASTSLCRWIHLCLCPLLRDARQTTVRCLEHEVAGGTVLDQGDVAAVERVTQPTRAAHPPVREVRELAEESNHGAPCLN